MICNGCGDYMELINKYGDGYYEPHEYVYICDCGAKCVDNQAYGEEWTYPKNYKFENLEEEEWIYMKN